MKHLNRITISILSLLLMTLVYAPNTVLAKETPHEGITEVYNSTELNEVTNASRYFTVSRYFSLGASIPASIVYGELVGAYYYQGTLWKREITNVYNGNTLTGHIVKYSGYLPGYPPEIIMSNDFSFSSIHQLFS